jgi:hypothetical protein
MGTTLEDQGSIDQHYASIARIIAAHTAPSVLIIQEIEWDNQELQETLIEQNKHYAIGLPNIGRDRVLEPHFDPDRWK